MAGTVGEIGIFFEDGCFQLLVENGDLKADDGLETAVTISLFSDKRVPASEIPDGLETRQGWWGDLFPDVENDKIGSKLWTLSRAKNTLETLTAFENETKAALQWMLDDGVAKSISVTASFDEYKRMILAISITKPEDNQASEFGFIWDGQDVRRTA